MPLRRQYHGNFPKRTTRCVLLKHRQPYDPIPPRNQKWHNSPLHPFTLQPSTVYASLSLTSLRMGWFSEEFTLHKRRHYSFSIRLALLSLVCIKPPRTDITDDRRWTIRKGVQRRASCRDCIKRCPCTEVPWRCLFHISTAMYSVTVPITATFFSSVESDFSCNLVDAPRPVVFTEPISKFGSTAGRLFKTRSFLSFASSICCLVISVIVVRATNARTFDSVEHNVTWPMMRNDTISCLAGEEYPQTLDFIQSNPEIKQPSTVLV